MVSAVICTLFDISEYVPLVLLAVNYCIVMPYVMLQNSFLKISFKFFLSKGL